MIIMPNENINNIAKGTVQLTIRSTDGTIITPEEYAKLSGTKLSDLGFDDHGVINNQIVDGFHYVLSKLFMTNAINRDIYLAVGSGTTPVDRSDSKLVTEVQRVVVRREYDTTASGSSPDPKDPDATNVVRFIGTIDTGAFDIYELGLYWGDDVATTADSGHLMSRVVTTKPLPKLNNIILEFVWQYSFKFLS